MHIFRKCSNIFKILAALLCVIFILLLCFKSMISEKWVKVALKLQKQLDETNVKLRECIFQKNDEHLEFLKKKPVVPVSAKQIKGLPGERLVHLDLKGAAPKMSYLLKLLPLLRGLRATGVLLEYEDMFPYTGKLRVLSSRNAYSFLEIKEFLHKAEELNLDVIPLVPTLGHLEFVLKHLEFKELRETPKYPNMPCPLHEKTNRLVKKMINQILDAHPKISNIHLGGDEVFNLKDCQQCVKSNKSKSELYLHHMIPLFEHVKERSYNKIQPIIWDDMLRKWSVNDMKKISSLTDIMVWGYVPDLRGYSLLPHDMWERYGKVFSSLWIASSFKGAYSANNNLVPISMHIKNHESWLQLSKLIKSKIKGIALTGWARYDHMSALCELLPAAVPSLGLCLRLMTEGSLKHRSKEFVESLLSFNKNPIIIEKDVFGSWDTTIPGFVGGDVYSLVAELENHVSWYESTKTRLDSWANDRQLNDQHISLLQVKGISDTLKQLSPSFKSFRKKCLTTLSPYFTEDTVDEWIQDKVDAYILLVTQLNKRLANITNTLKIEL